MYEAFFSLEDAPFVLTPDPRFLLRSKGHHEILGTLLYGITSQKGLMALIGEVGTGKTTLCRALLREMPKDVQSALVLNPHLSDIELVGTILDDLGIERRGATKGELMTALSQHLLAAGGEGKTVVVILDEAQQMSVDALEQIRILSTLETATRKLLQIVLSGQPELEEKLKQRELRQLDQRIGIRCYLKPLSRKDTFRYVEHRMRIAGLPGALPFTRAAMARIFAYSLGIPRVINMVCDRALMAAFSARAHEINPALVKAAIKNLQGESRGRRRGAAGAGGGRRSGRAAIAAGALGAVLVGGAAAGYWTGWSPPVFRLPWRADAPGAATRPRGAVPMRASAPSAGQPAVVGRGEPGAAPRDGQSRETLPRDGMKSLLVQVLRLWGVNEELSDGIIAAWPVDAARAPDLAAIAASYQLSATLLPETTLAELRAIALPALMETGGSEGARALLLRGIEGDTAVLATPTGEETHIALDRLEAAWNHQAWIIWRNIDLLPADPNQELTPTVVATLALRLQKLGHLTPPVPTTNNERFQQAVRRFQRATGLQDDGIVGPRTTLALSRVIGGRFSPTITDTKPR
ncbi:MAG: AAA family ATPase [Candidatus Rokubacteria bacterium]|nr:AAA family ATPase [Candidatus Rokubacteria bacterium]